MSGRYACQIRSVRSSSSMRSVLSASPAASKRQSSTPVACSEKIAKFVPSPSHVAPSGYGVPGQTRRLGMLHRLEAGAPERLLGLGIGRRSPPPERGELGPSPTPDRLGELGAFVAREVRKRRGLGVFLAHEQEGKVGRDQHSAGGELGPLEPSLA